MYGDYHNNLFARCQPQCYMDEGQRIKRCDLRGLNA